MRECNDYLTMNHPLVSVPGTDLGFDAIHAQMQRCSAKGCDGSRCCAHLSTMALSRHERMHSCMVDDTIDDDCRVCCWILNGLKCVEDPATSGCAAAGTTSPRETIHPALASSEGVYTGCQTYEVVFPQLMTNFRAATKVDPMHNATEEFVASLVASDTIHSRTVGYDGAHLVYTPEYTETAVHAIVHPALDDYVSVWKDDIRTNVYNRAEHAMLDATVRGYSKGAYLPPTLYCMESTGMCTLGGDGLTRGRSTPESVTPTLVVGGGHSFDRVEWVNRRSLTIDDTEAVRSIRSHRTRPAYFGIGTNVMQADTTLRAPRLE